MATESPMMRNDPGLPPTATASTLVRARPRLPRLGVGLGHSATLPRSRSTDLPRAVSTQDIHAQTEKDLQGAVDSLGKTDFLRKYSLKGRVRNLGSPSSTPSKSPTPSLQPFNFGAKPVTLRRTRSVKLAHEPDGPSNGGSACNSRAETPTYPGSNFFHQVSLKLKREKDLNTREESPSEGISIVATDYSSEVELLPVVEDESQPEQSLSNIPEGPEIPLVDVTEDSLSPVELVLESQSESITGLSRVGRGNNDDAPVMTRIAVPGPITLHSAESLQNDNKKYHPPLIESTCDHKHEDTLEIDHTTYELEHKCIHGDKHFLGQVCVKDMLQKFGSTSGKRVHGVIIHNGSKGANGRFLTHPPLQHHVAPANGGYVDSNGLASLKDRKGGIPEAGNLKPEESDVSLADSHLSPSETTETPTYGDVIADITSQPYSIQKLERRNIKVPKVKSISDPSSKKRKQIQIMDLPTILSASSPDVSDRGSESSQPTTPLRKEFAPGVSVTGETSPDNKDFQDFFDDDSQEEDNWKTPPLSRESSVEKEPVPAPKVRRKSDKHRKVLIGPSMSSDVASDQSSSATDVSQPEGSSLELPARKSSIGRSHSSASVLIRKAEQDAVRHNRSNSGGSQEDELTELVPAVSVPDIPGPKRKPQRKAILEPDASFSGSDDFLDKAPQNKDKRDLIVSELYSTERQYVESLQMLVEKYMIPMKTQSMMDSALVDDIFYKINEIYMHHATFLSFMGATMKTWDSTRTIGGIIHQTFSKQSVIESYLSYINHFPRAEKVLDALNNKSSFQRFVEQCERETRNKLPLKAQIVKPAQRIPRYELLLRRLLEHTPCAHADFKLLQQAEKSIHNLALKINSVKESKAGDNLQETLKKLELMLITDLMAADRFYIRHDMVTIMGRKDQCCVWLFSDLAVFTSVKRKSGTINRKTTLLLQSPSGHDFAENVKHKTWLRVALEDMEIVTGVPNVKGEQTADKEQLEGDQVILHQMTDMTGQLQTVTKQTLEDCLADLLTQVTRQLEEQNLKSPPPAANRTDLLITAPSGLTNLTVVFSSPDKKNIWETQLSDAKQKLSVNTETCQPEFQQALPITKTRAGMQFSCASPIDGVNPLEYKEVWVCNSDGYVGHVCLLSLQPEPIVTLNTPVPGCNARILCICAVPTFQPFRRQGSSSRKHSAPHFPREIPSIEIKTSSTSSHDEDEDGYVTDSSMSSSDDEAMPLRLPPVSGSRSPSPSPSQGPQETSVQDPEKSTMWLGTEDGYIHIFHATDNVKTTRNRIKVQHNAGVLCIVSVDQKVFVSLANGSLVVYLRAEDGSWDIENPQKLSLGSATSPVNKMLSVMGKVWCACQNEIMVLSPSSLNVECSFTVSSEVKKSVCCMASSGLGVWLAAQGSSKVTLYHAKTYQCILEVNMAQAVAQKLQTADDIIKQHKTACLRITSLLACKDLLWVGTSAGVVLTLPVPKVSASTDKGSIPTPVVTGLLQGHTGHVRFLTAVDMSGPGRASPSGSTLAKRRTSVTAHSVSMATKMLIISGGDGFEDFKTGNSEQAGKDDSTNHLLLWQI